MEKVIARVAKRINVEESQDLAKAMEGFIEPKGCYKNALLALLTQSGMHDCFYVEGVAVMAQTHIVYEHAWIENAEGEVIDPTLSTQQDTYYAAYRWSYEQAKNLVNTRLPIFHLGDSHLREVYMRALNEK